MGLFSPTKIHLFLKYFDVNRIPVVKKDCAVSPILTLLFVSVRTKKTGLAWQKFIPQGL
jgi:hypothetical protein